jgi:hypothetical protein
MTTRVISVRRHEAAAFWAAGLGLAALFVALGALGPERLPGPGLCLFHAVTGWACPGCGLTRAAAAAARFSFAESLRWHPLFPLLALEIAFAMALWGRRLFFGREWPRRAIVPAALATGGLFLAVWIARAAAGTLPP